MSDLASTRWKMLKDAFGEVISGNPGYRVKQALFTTYAFDPGFFETSIIPLLLPEGDSDFSLHPVLRRIRLEAYLREHPISLDVYFDARVCVPGCPLLPYNMVPVKLANQAEFHGKVILILLEDDDGNQLCSLGVGSANLTKAGWWENLEAWYFLPAFAQAKTPAGLLDGIKELLTFLGENCHTGTAHKAFSDFFEGARKTNKVPSPVFGIFTGQMPFTDWLKRKLSLTGGHASTTPIEVISPYFAEDHQGELVDGLCSATAANQVKVWLPIDPWRTGGAAALIREKAFEELSDQPSLTWGRFSDPTLSEARSGKAIPRFLHAKLIRRPGHFSFMGSVNFSHKAFKVNFEAGLLFEDHDKAWLKNTDERPQRFIDPPVEAAVHSEDLFNTEVELQAIFSWKTHILEIKYQNRRKKKTLRFSLLRSQGEETGIDLVLPDAAHSPPLTDEHPMFKDLLTNPWVKLRFEDGRIGLAWVQHVDLDFRPLGVDLDPDLLQILSMWRQLAGGKAGSQPIIDLTQLEINIGRRNGDGEQPPSGDLDRDIFAEMSDVHAGFFLLRQLLKTEPRRVPYYFGVDRPDSLRTVLSKSQQQWSKGQADPAVLWVVLQWIIQVCSDHPDAEGVKALQSQATSLLKDLLSKPPLSELDAKFLNWSRLMFLTTPGHERGVGQHLRPSKEAS